MQPRAPLLSLTSILAAVLARPSPSPIVQGSQSGIAAAACPPTIKAGKAHCNQAGEPLKGNGFDFVPTSKTNCGTRGPGLYVVYSSRIAGGCFPGSANNASIYLIELADGDVLMFGAGYGDTCVAATGAFCDMRVVDHVIRNRMFLGPAASAIRFVAPHGHVDHVNTEALRSLQLDYGYTVLDIAYHVDDYDLDYIGPSIAEMDWSWTPAGTLVALSAVDPVTKQVLDVNGGTGAFDSVIGPLRFFHRPGHTPGSLDLVIDLAAPSADIMLRGSTKSGISPVFLYDLKAHGNALTNASCGC